MGVKFLTTFAKEQNLQIKVNILDEIRKRRLTGGNATIIFDVMGFVHSFGRSAIELNLGGRQHIYLNDFKKFLTKLRAAGATLVFCCDGQLHCDKYDEWCRRRDGEFNSALSLIKPELNRNKTSKRRFGCKTICKSLLKLVVENDYGEVIVSTKVDCDVAIAKLANSNNALAVIANDSDFIIFEGDFQLWLATTINFCRLEAECFDRIQLRQTLGLSHEQMKYMATIAGNDSTNHIGMKRRGFFEIAEFIRSIQSNQEDTLICQAIAKFMMPHRQITQSVLDSIGMSIKSYCIDLDSEAMLQRATADDIASSNVLKYAFLNQKNFQYEVNFLDFQLRNNNNNANNNNNNNVNHGSDTAKTFLDQLLDVFRKLGGILSEEMEKPIPILKIVTKYSLQEKYTLKTHKPICPKDDDMMTLLGASFDSDVKKWNLLLWSINLELFLQFDLRKIPDKYIMTVLALMFLHRAGEISELQADAILTSQYNLLELKDNSTVRNTDESDTLEDSIRIGRLFDRTIMLLWDCLTVCGLQSFIELDWYDGPYVHHLLKRFQRSKTFYNQSVKKINAYRLYATYRSPHSNI